MSFNVQTLKSASDDNVPSFLRDVEVGTTANLFHNSIYEWGLICKGARVVNLDALNNLDLLLHTRNVTRPRQAIPPNSEFLINEWFAEIFLEPDGASGSFQLTLEVANLNDARKIQLGRPRGVRTFS